MSKSPLEEYMEEQHDKWIRQQKSMHELTKYASKRDASGGYVWTVADMQKYFNRKKK